MISIVDKYLILRMKKEGKTNEEIAKELDISRNTVSRYWNKYKNLLFQIENCSDDEEAKKLAEEIAASSRYDTSKRGAIKYNEKIDNALRKILDDENKKTERLGPHHKQALTDTQIHELLVEAGFDIGRTTIGTKIREIRNEKNEAFIKQDYDFGERFEYDFGEIVIMINGNKTKGFLAVMTAPASGFRWAYLYPNSKMDVFLDSQVKFFEMIGGCFKEGVYDNMRNVVSKFIGRNEKELNSQLIYLSLYYDFTINVTNCFSGNEKGTVENAVRWIRNRMFALKYQFDSFEDAYQYLQDKLIKINENSLIEEEKKYLSPYRPKYETAIYTENRVDKYSFIHIDSNSYSVPEELCEKTVSVKTYPSEIVVLYKGQEIARHNRCYEKGKTCVEIRHYLHTFTKKPGALRNSTALKSLPELKQLFDTYYKEKPKEFIQLLRDNSHLDNKELLKALDPLKTVSDIQSKETINKKTDEQIKKISNMFIGGTNLVH